jgi:hypothetical protein
MLRHLLEDRFGLRLRGETRSGVDIFGAVQQQLGPEARTQSRTFRDHVIESVSRPTPD